MGTPQEKGFKVEDQKQAMKWNLFILRMWGYWPPETNDQKALIRYRIYAIFILGLTFLSYVVLEVMSLLTADSIEDMVSSSLVLFTHMMQFVKLYCLQSKRSYILEIMNKLNQEAFTPQSRKHKELLQNQVRRGRMNYVIFLILAVSTVSLWYIFPFVETTGEMDLPLKVWFPFDIHAFPVFQIVYVYQFTIIMLNAVNDISMVGVISIFMANVCGQLDILNDKLHSLGKAENGEEIRGDENGLCVSEIHDYKTRQALEDCVQHHLKIIDYVEQLQSVYSLTIFSQFCASTITLCVTLYQIVSVPPGSLQFVSMVLYLLCMFLQFFSYCWFGNEIMIKSDQLTMSIYFSDWLNLSDYYKKNMIFIMLRTQTLTKMYAGYFFTLSLETFVNVLRSSMAYFSVLNSVQEQM